MDVTLAGGIGLAGLNLGFILGVGYAYLMRPKWRDGPDPPQTGGSGPPPE